MRLIPRSLFGRLLALSALSTVLALTLAGLAIGHVLERFVMRSLDQRLDTQVLILAAAIRPDGTLDTARVVVLPDFAATGSGWIWQVRSHGRTWSNITPALAIPPLPPGPDHDRHAEPRPGEIVDARRHRLHIRQLVVARPGGPVTIAAAGPRGVVDAPLREAMVPLLASLALLGIGLGAAALLQLRLGLRPVRALRDAVAQVARGERDDIPAGQPTELAPLANELNALIARNAAQLAQARGHVANLAHGLKTPLAALALRIQQSGVDRDSTLAEAVADIDHRIAHHLRRARAAAPGGPGASASPADAVAALVDALRRLHADHAVAVDVAIAPALAVAVDPQDLDEMLGNLLDNAWRHATSRIRVAADRGATGVAIAIEDDGPGLSAAQRDEAMIAGRRLDEQAPGHGFGLPITRELAELNGGGVRLEASPALGGLRVVLDLPAARGSTGQRERPIPV